MEPTTGEKPVQALVVREVGPSEIGGLSGAAAPSPPPQAAAVAVAPLAAVAPAPPSMTGAAGMVTPSTEFRKKRGRPRKYEGQQGQPRATLSPMPISASIPLSGDCSGWNHSQGKATQPSKKKQKVLDKVVDDPMDQLLSYTAGSCFTPHQLTVNAGEDVSQKIMSFSPEGATVICILSATGSISNVTLRQPNSSGGTLTHEGWFDLISLNGSFTVSDIGGARSRAGGMSVALVAPDGRIIAGGLAGLLVAATPVQVVVGTFLHVRRQDHQQEPKAKKKTYEPAVPTSLFTSYQSNHTNITFGSGFERSYSDQNLNFSPANAKHGSDSKEVNPTQCEVSC